MKIVASKSLDIERVPEALDLSKHVLYLRIDTCTEAATREVSSIL
jgi:hypothetical protein